MALTLLSLAHMTRHERGQRGFTLIEMIVVTGIIGILSAIALPQFAGRQGMAYDKMVQSDCRLAASAQEAYFVDHLSYSSDCASLPAFTQSHGVVFTDCNGTIDSFRVATDHPNSNQTCSWDSTIRPSLVCTPK